VLQTKKSPSTPIGGRWRQVFRLHTARHCTA
jgi:hypothetical protein